jgi:hypothetical protein
MAHGSAKMTTKALPAGYQLILSFALAGLPCAINHQR